MSEEESNVVCIKEKKPVDMSEVESNGVLNLLEHSLDRAKREGWEDVVIIYNKPSANAESVTAMSWETKSSATLHLMIGVAKKIFWSVYSG